MPNPFKSIIIGMQILSPSAITNTDIHTETKQKLKNISLTLVLLISCLFPNTNHIENI